MDGKPNEEVINTEKVKDNTNPDDKMTTEVKRSPCRLNVSLIWIKLAYAFGYMKDSCYWTFMVLYLTNVGLTPSQAGVVNGLRFLGALVGVPFIGMLVDRRQSHRKAFFFLCIMVTVLTGCQPFLSMINMKNNANNALSIGNNSTATDAKKMITNNEFNTDENKTEISNSKNGAYFQTNNRKYNRTKGKIKLTDTKNDASTGNMLFYLLLFTNVVNMFFDGVIVSFVDSATLLKIRQTSYPVDFGWQRAFGSLGYASGVLVSSLAIDVFPRSRLFSVYAPVFLVHFICILGLIVSFYKVGEGVTFESTPTNSTRLLFKHLRKPENIVFLITVFFIGTGNSFCATFLSVLLKKEMEAPTWYVGVSFAAAGVVTVIAMLFSTSIIRKLGGPWNTMLLGLASWGIRYVCYYFVHVPWLVLFIQLFQAPCFGTTVPAIFEHVRQVSPPGIFTSFCACTNLTFFIVSNLLGNLLGGVLYERFKIRTLFLFFALGFFSWGLVLATFIFYRKKKEKKGNARQTTSVLMSDIVKT